MNIKEVAKLKIDLNNIVEDVRSYYNFLQLVEVGMLNSSESIEEKLESDIKDKLNDLSDLYSK